MTRKRIIFSLLLLFTVTFFALAQKRTVADAKRIAMQRRLSDKATVILSSEVLPDRANNASEVFFVVTEGTTAKGAFVIVAGDERMGNVLAYSDYTSFPAQDIPSSVLWWLEQCSRQNDNIDGNGGFTAFSLDVENVDPLVSTRWGQLAPFNELCPVVDGTQTATGCVATAMGQALSVFKYPTSATGTVYYTTSTHGISISENLADYPFIWDEMLDSYVNGYNETQARAVANLMYSCGLSVKMDYSAESGTPTSNVLGAAIDRFGYDKDMVFANLDAMQIVDWHSLLTANIAKGMPVIYSARNEFDEGHCFVLDGYSTTDSELFYHVNWGWGGRCNGNYRIFDLAPAEPGTGGGSGNFNLQNTAILGFRPDDGIGENSGFLQAKSITLTPQEIAPGVTSSIVEISSLSNYGANVFNGTLLLCIADADGSNEQVVDTYELHNINFMSGLNSIKRRITLHPTLAAGDYIIKVYACADGFEKIPLYSSTGFPKLTLLPNRQEFHPDLLVTDLTIDVEGERDLTVNAMHLLNNANVAFAGKLALALADNDGEMLSMFGDEYSVENLLSGKTLSDEIQVNGTIPLDFSDGKYRVYLMSQQAEYDDWVPVTGYSVSDGEIEIDRSSHFCVIKIENGVISVSEEDLPEYYAHLEATSLSASDVDTVAGHVTLTASGIRNFAERDFVGTLKMVVCDDDGNIVSLFGDEYSITQPLVSGETMEQPVSLTGNFPMPSVDGKYSLRFVTKQKYCRGLSLMRKYVLAVLNITDYDLPCGVDFWIIDGTVSFDAPRVFVESIELNKESLSMSVGGTYQLHATVMPEDASDKTVIWSSTNPDVATVSQDGNVVAWSAGDVAISASAADGSSVVAVCNVTVMPVLAQSISLNYTRYTLDPGRTVQLVANVLPRNTSNKVVAWDSSDPAVATVDDKGLVTLLTEGAAYITATTTDGTNLSATCVVSSHNYMVEAIFINPPESTLSIGESISLEAIVLPYDALNKDVVWSSSFPSIVSVNQNGVATALKDGKAIVYATATDGSNVSGSCIFNCTSGIVTLIPDETVRFYMPDGKPLETPRKGLNIIVDEKGAARKVINK